MGFNPTWDLLRTFGNSRFAKLTIFVPLFSYLIIFNNAFAEFVASSMEWVCVSFNDSKCLSENFENIDNEYMLRRVINIYIALSSIALSTLFFQLFCPHEIKKYLHSEIYVAENMKIFHHEFNRNIRNILDGATPEDMKRIQGTFDKYKEHDRPKASEMYDRDILSSWFSYQNNKFFFARWVCFILFFVGILLLAYPTIITFFKVISIAWG